MPTQAHTQKGARRSLCRRSTRCAFPTSQPLSICASRHTAPIMHGVWEGSDRRCWETALFLSLFRISGSQLQFQSCVCVACRFIKDMSLLWLWLTKGQWTFYFKEFRVPHSERWVLRRKYREWMKTLCVFHGSSHKGNENSLIILLSIIPNERHTPYHRVGES